MWLVVTVYEGGNPTIQVNGYKEPRQPLRVSIDENCLSFAIKMFMHLKNKGKCDWKTQYK